MARTNGCQNTFSHPPNFSGFFFPLSFCLFRLFPFRLFFFFFCTLAFFLPRALSFNSHTGMSSFTSLSFSLFVFYFCLEALFSMPPFTMLRLNLRVPFFRSILLASKRFVLSLFFLLFFTSFKFISHSLSPSSPLTRQVSSFIFSFIPLYLAALKRFLLLHFPLFSRFSSGVACLLSIYL